MAENENIDDYSIEDLKNLLEIKDLTIDTVDEKTDIYIEKFKNENNQEMVEFFENVKEKLTQYVNNEQSEEWWDNQNLTQANVQQNNKRVQRKNKIKFFNNDKFVMKREALGVGNGFGVPIAQDQLNPHLENMTERIITIDSRYRQQNVPAAKDETLAYSSIGNIQDSSWSNTNFTLDLSQQMTNVVALELYSVQIPVSWYNVDKLYGTNCFSIQYTLDDAAKTIMGPYDIIIESGNYDAASLKDAVNEKLTSEVFNGAVGTYIDYVTITGKIKFSLPDIVDAKQVLDYKLTFFDKTLESNTNCSSCIGQSKLNNSLGWTLGFKDPTYTLTTIVSNEFNLTADTVVDLLGPRYFTLLLDDYNSNRVDKSVVSIQSVDTKLSLPKYYTPGEVVSTVGDKYVVEKPDCIAATSDKPVPTPFYTQNLPKTITQAQAYTMNEIIKNRKNAPNNKLIPPTTNNVFAVIPIRPRSFGTLLVEFSSPFQKNRREYFGPVDIEKLKVTLLDDKGYTVNLNGVDWSFTILSSHLYQY